MNVKAITAVIAGLITIGVSACGTSAAPPAAHASATAHPAVQSCGQKVKAWSRQEGSTQLGSVGRGSGQLSVDFDRLVREADSGASLTAGLASLTTAASQLGADSQTALANPPPACDLGMNDSYRSAMAEAYQASQDTITGAGQATDGNDLAARATFRATDSALAKATADLKAMNP